eukprot:13793981-Alexandrium_andersonii.AAC.1
MRAERASAPAVPVAWKAALQEKSSGMAPRRRVGPGAAHSSYGVPCTCNNEDAATGKAASSAPAERR